MHVIPAIDVLDGSVVRLHRGDFDSKTVYRDDPAVQLGEFAALGADLVHVVDLEAARTGRSTPGLWDALGAAGVPFQAGGGIRDAATARRVIDAGATRVVVGTAAVWDQALLEGIVAGVGAERVVAALDVRDGRARGAGWIDEGRPLPEVMTAISDAGVGAVLVTSVVKDGTLAGPDLSLLKTVSRAAGWEVTASGGIGRLSDITALVGLGLWGVIVGRALYERRFTLPEAFAVADV